MWDLPLTNCTHLHISSINATRSHASLLLQLWAGHVLWNFRGQNNISKSDCLCTLSRFTLHRESPLYSDRPSFKSVFNICSVSATLCLATYFVQSRDSVVGIATGYGLEDRGVGVRVPVGWRIFSSTRLSDVFWGPPSLLSNGYRGFFPRV
jgi:hypothetical protein